MHYNTLHYGTLHHTTLHYTTVHYTADHYTTVHYSLLGQNRVKEWSEYKEAIFELSTIANPSVGSLFGVIYIFNFLELSA